jgi:hypothetical protein
MIELKGIALRTIFENNGNYDFLSLIPRDWISLLLEKVSHLKAVGSLKHFTNKFKLSKQKIPEKESAECLYLKFYFL